MINKLSFLCLVLLLVLFACSQKAKPTISSNDYFGQFTLSANNINAGTNYKIVRIPGMVYIPSGVTVIGANDEDLNGLYLNKPSKKSINGFWMDATEISNSIYKQFVKYAIDSTVAQVLNLTKDEAVNTASAKSKNPTSSKNSTRVTAPSPKTSTTNRATSKKPLDLQKVATLNLSDPQTVQKLKDKNLIVTNPLTGGVGINVMDVEYAYAYISYQKVQSTGSKLPMDSLLVKKMVKVYPDTLVWMIDFSYANNEPMVRGYFSKPQFSNYPVVGVNWNQANAFCQWRTFLAQEFLKGKGGLDAYFRLPSEPEWEYAARGGLSEAMYPWGGPYIINKQGCYLANFKNLRGDYSEDGAQYTARVDSYFPNSYGLYNMSGNASEWTSSAFSEESYLFMNDLAPSYEYNAKPNDPPAMKRKVIRGGSWKDVAMYLACGSRDYEYQDSSRSYIGFRCVIDLPSPAFERVK
ncbi:MAG: SUMF1/EgtB/PvdO family nonheme iron enzyme [Chitinophagaceae bacterium]